MQVTSSFASVLFPKCGTYEVQGLLNCFEQETPCFLTLYPGSLSETKVRLKEVRGIFYSYHEAKIKTKIAVFHQKENSIFATFPEREIPLRVFGPDAGSSVKLIKEEKCRD